MQSNKITNDFYDDITRQILLVKLSEDDNVYIKEEQLDLDDMLFKQWNTIISSFTCDYYNEYASTPENSRNTWFQKYIDLHRH